MSQRNGFDCAGAGKRKRAIGAAQQHKHKQARMTDLHGEPQVGAIGDLAAAVAGAGDGTAGHRQQQVLGHQLHSSREMQGRAECD